MSDELCACGHVIGVLRGIGSDGKVWESRVCRAGHYARAEEAPRGSTFTGELSAAMRSLDPATFPDPLNGSGGNPHLTIAEARERAAKACRCEGCEGCFFNEQGSCTRVRRDELSKLCRSCLEAHR